MDTGAGVGPLRAASPAPMDTGAGVLPLRAASSTPMDTGAGIGPLLAASESINLDGEEDLFGGSEDMADSIALARAEAASAADSHRAAIAGRAIASTADEPFGHLPLPIRASLGKVTNAVITA